jgi:hypothetical protein
MAFLLDEFVDTRLTPPVGNVARAGSFKADQLLVSAGTDAAKCNPFYSRITGF